MNYPMIYLQQPPQMTPTRNCNRILTHKEHEIDKVETQIEELQKKLLRPGLGSHEKQQTESSLSLLQKDAVSMKSRFQKSIAIRTIFFVFVRLNVISNRPTTTTRSTRCCCTPTKHNGLQPHIQTLRFYNNHHHYSHLHNHHNRRYHSHLHNRLLIKQHPKRYKINYIAPVDHFHRI